MEKYQLCYKDFGQNCLIVVLSYLQKGDFVTNVTVKNYVPNQVNKTKSY